MRPSRPSLHLLYPRLALLLSLMFLAGLSACGPASDNAPNLGPSASVDGPSLSKQGSAPRTDAFTLVATPLPRSMGQTPRQEMGPSQEGAVPTRCLFSLLSQDTQWRA